jgi:hypothetical protein
MDEPRYVLALIALAITAALLPELIVPICVGMVRAGLEYVSHIKPSSREMLSTVFQKDP